MNDRKDILTCITEINAFIEWIFNLLIAALAWMLSELINTLRPRQNCRHFADDIFKHIFLNENVWILIKISLKFVHKVPINNIPALIQIMAWCPPGDKPLSEPMMVTLQTHLCITRPQWYSTMWHCHQLFQGGQITLNQDEMDLESRDVLDSCGATWNHENVIGSIFSLCNLQYQCELILAHIIWSCFTSVMRTREGNLCLSVTVTHSSLFLYKEIFLATVCHPCGYWWDPNFKSISVTWKLF